MGAGPIGKYAHIALLLTGGYKVNTWCKNEIMDLKRVLSPLQKWEGKESLASTIEHVVHM